MNAEAFARREVIFWNVCPAVLGSVGKFRTSWFVCRSIRFLTNANTNCVTTDRNRKVVLTFTLLIAVPVGDGCRLHHAFTPVGLGEESLDDQKRAMANRSVNAEDRVRGL